MTLVQRLRVSLALTGDGATELVDKLDHQAAREIEKLLCTRLGVEMEKEHAWGGFGQERKKK
jgi:hypothetical protein